MPRLKPRFKLDLKRALIPLSLGLCFALYFIFHVPLGFLGLFCLWMPLYYIILPSIAARQWRDFEHDFARRFPLGEHAQLLQRWRSSLILRHFGPEVPMLGKLGILYIGLGKLPEAEATLERGALIADKSNRERILLNLASVKLKLGRLDDAAQIYRRLLPKSPFRALAQTRLAVIDVRLGRNLDEATRHLQQALPTARNEERDLITEALASREAR